MAKILITSGPTRQYLDPVRYLTNASSGLMGRTLAQAALNLGHQVVVVSGPVEVSYPTEAEVVPVISTEEMLEAAKHHFPGCDGAIGVAAPCDYRPQRVSDQKLSKTGGPLVLHLIETPDVIATLGASKRGKGPIKNLKGWLFRVATFVINDYFREKFAHPHVELSADLPSDQQSPAQILDEQLESEWLRNAIGSLPDEQQHVIALRFGAGLKISEVAESMGKSAGAIKQLQLRVLKSLQQQRTVGGYEE